MDASVFVVGSEPFLAAFVNRIRTFVSGTVEASSYLNEAIPLIQAKQPAVLIVQAAVRGSLELCCQIKEQTQLGWIYCILVDYQSPTENKEGSFDRDWELTALAEALEEGADAYLRMSTGERGTATAFAEERLLKAQIQVGLRSVQFYRELMGTNDVLSTMALADPLTELSNRRAMEWELPRQIHNARAQSTPLSLIMLDVDYFKSINDNYGHQVGDRVLQLLSARLQHNLRLQDTLFRYGGEEFVVVLSQTNLKEAEIVAQRLRRLIGEQPFNMDETLAVEITISLGVTVLSARDDTKGESLLRRADYNLLRAKADGRDRMFSCKDWT
jgi:two-component system cell cycle response regulator